MHPPTHTVVVHSTLYYIILHSFNFVIEFVENFVGFGAGAHDMVAEARLIQAEVW